MRFQWVPPAEEPADYAVLFGAAIPTAVWLARVVAAHYPGVPYALLVVVPLLPACLWVYYYALEFVRSQRNTLARLLAGQRRAGPDVDAEGAKRITRVLTWVGIAAVFFDPTGWISTGVAAVAVALCFWQSPWSIKPLYVVPFALVLASWFVPARYGFGARTHGAPGAQELDGHIVGAGSMVRYLAVGFAVLLFKARIAGFWRVLLVFTGIFVTATTILAGAMAAGGSNPVSETFRPHDAAAAARGIVLLDEEAGRVLLNALGFRVGRLVAWLVVVSYLGFPLSLRIAWNAVGVSSVSDAIVGYAIEAHGWLSSLALGLLCFEVIGKSEPLLAIPALLVLAAYALPDLQAADVGEGFLSAARSR